MTKRKRTTEITIEEHMENHTLFTKKGRRVPVKDCYFCENYDDMVLPTNARLVEEDESKGKVAEEYDEDW